MKSESLRDMMLAIRRSDAATEEQRQRALFLAMMFDPRLEA